MAAEATISVQCACGKKLKAPATAVGRKAKCPKCGAVMTVEAPPPLPEADPFDDALYDLSGGEAEPLAAPPPLPSPQRPPATIKGASATAKGASGVPSNLAYPTLQTRVDVDKPAPTGSLLKGAIISAGFAFLGALAWYGVARALKAEIGWIAWGVGIAAGFGMMIGYNGTSVRAGAVAAALSVGGIIVGKLMVFFMVVLPLFSNVLNKMIDALPDDRKLHVWVTNQQLRQKSIEPTTARPAERDAAGAEADKIIAKMDADTKQAELQKASASLKSRGSSYVHDVDKASLFRRTMFSPADIVFMALAVASAFKVATFGGQVEPG